MSLAGLRIPLALPIALNFAPCESSIPLKHIKLDQMDEKSLTSVTDTLMRPEEQEQKAKFCCVYHRDTFEREFDSGNEEDPKRKTGKHEKVVFMRHIPLDIQYYLIQKRKSRDDGTQHEERDGPALSVLADCRVISSEDTQCPEIPAQTYSGPYHLPEYTQPKLRVAALRDSLPGVPLGEEPCIECQECNQRFRSGQALGGHTSRKHRSRLTLSPHKYMRRSDDELGP